MKDFSYITHSHPAYIESLYQDFLSNPESVDPEYRKFFEGFDFALSNGTNGQASAQAGLTSETLADPEQLAREFSVYNLILAYRKKGHLEAKTNPIRERKDRGANLGLKYFGLGDADLQRNFEAGRFVGLGNAKLQDIVNRLQQVYCGHVGIESQYIVNSVQLEWIQNEMEQSLQPAPSSRSKKNASWKN
jgi:2-oxoglutarate dehydrogenase E1 component